MSAASLVLPRRVAIRLLSEAQRAQDREVTGVIGARDGIPVSVVPSAGPSPEGDEALRKRGESLWASYRSHPAADWRPAPDELLRLGRRAPHLVISLDTKGVLQLRCWRLEGGTVVEHDLSVQD